MSFILGDVLPKESITVEYKVFRMELMYSYDMDYKKLFHDHSKLERIFRNIMLRNIEKYIAKYASSFFNSRIDGVLRFGVSDEGEVIGVPIPRDDVYNYFEKLKSKIRDQIKIYCYNKNPKCICPQIQLRFHKIRIYDYIFDTYPKTEDYLKSRESDHIYYTTLYTNYIESKRLYMDAIEKHRRPINVIINDLDIREDFRDYLKGHGVFEKYERDLVDNNNIIFPDRSIKILKHDPENLTHWITRYRDDKTDYIIKNMRPVWDYRVRPVDPHFSLMQDFRSMVDTLIDRGFDMYIIDIRFNFFDRNPMWHDIGHFCEGEIRFPKRTLDESGEPCCMF